MSFELSSGAEARWTNPGRPCVVVCVDGGTAAEVEGTWSASVEWLVHELAPAVPEASFLEVRYRVKSWRQLDLCIEDGAAAIVAARDAGAKLIPLLAFSMGGAVASAIGGAPETPGIVAVNPWLPHQLDLGGLRGKRFAIAHGAFDAPLPGIPGVRPAHSRAGAERARAAGADVERVVIPRAVHPVALRAPWGDPVRMPGAGRYARFVRPELARLCA